MAPEDGYARLTNEATRNASTRAGLTNVHLVAQSLPQPSYGIHSLTPNCDRSSYAGSKAGGKRSRGRLVTGASQLPCFTSLSRSLRRDDCGRGFAAPAVPGASFSRGSVFGRAGQRGQVSLNTVSHFQQELGEVTCLFRGEADARLLHDRVAVSGAFLDLSQHAAGVRGLA